MSSDFARSAAMLAARNSLSSHGQDSQQSQVGRGAGHSKAPLPRQANADPNAADGQQAAYLEQDVNRHPNTNESEHGIVPKENLPPGLDVAGARNAQRVLARQQEQQARNQEKLARIINIAPEFATEHPPLKFEVEEKAHQQALHESAVSMAKDVYAARSAAEQAAKLAATQPEADDYHGNVQHQAASRLSKVNDPSEKAHIKDYYGRPKTSLDASTPARSKTQRILDRVHPALPFQTRRRSSANVIPSESGQQDSSQSRGKPSSPDMSSEEFRASRDAQAKPKSLIELARQRVMQQMGEMDNQVFSTNGKMSPAMNANWDDYVRQKQTENGGHPVPKRNFFKASQGSPKGKETRPWSGGKENAQMERAVDVGGGQLVDSAEIQKLAASRVQPELAKMDEAAFQRRKAEIDAEKREEERKQAIRDEKERQKEAKAAEKAVIAAELQKKQTERELEKRRIKIEKEAEKVKERAIHDEQARKKLEENQAKEMQRKRERDEADRIKREAHEADIAKKRKEKEEYDRVQREKTMQEWKLQQAREQAARQEREKREAEERRRKGQADLEERKRRALIEAQEKQRKEQIRLDEKKRKEEEEVERQKRREEREAEDRRRREELAIVEMRNRQEKLAKENARREEKEAEKQRKIEEKQQKEQAKKEEKAHKEQAKREEREAAIRKKEEERQAELKRKEEERQAELKRKEEERQAELQRQEEEKKRKEEERQAELRRQEEEKKRKEEERLAQLARIEAEKQAIRKRQEEEARRKEAEKQAAIRKQEEEKKRKEEERLAQLARIEAEKQIIKERQEEEARKKEAERQAAIKRQEEEKQRKEAEKQAAIQKQEEEKRRKEAEKQAAIQKHEEEKRRKEAEKQAAIQRHEEEKRRKEEGKQAAIQKHEEEKRRKEAEKEAAKQAAIQRKEDEKRRQEAEKQAAIQRQEDEKRRQEEKKQAILRHEEEEKRREEEEKEAARRATHDEREGYILAAIDKDRAEMEGKQAEKYHGNMAGIESKDQPSGEEDATVQQRDLATEPDAVHDLTDQNEEQKEVRPSEKAVSHGAEATAVAGGVAAAATHERPVTTSSRNQRDSMKADSREDKPKHGAFSKLRSALSLRRKPSDSSRRNKLHKSQPAEETAVSEKSAIATVEAPTAAENTAATAAVAGPEAEQKPVAEHLIPSLRPSNADRAPSHSDLYDVSEDDDVFVDAIDGSNMEPVSPLEEHEAKDIEFGEKIESRTDKLEGKHLDTKFHEEI